MVKSAGCVCSFLYRYSGYQEKQMIGRAALAMTAAQINEAAARLGGKRASLAIGFRADAKPILCGPTAPMRLSRWP